MTKTYLVYKNHYLRDYMDKTVYRGDQNPNKIYTEMVQMSIESAKKHLKGDWELVFFEDEYENYQEMIIEHHFRLFEMWKREPCHIIDMDSDTLWHRDIELSKFHSIKCLSTLGWTASCVYYPHEMSEKLWEMSHKQIKKWDKWADEQELYVSLMKAQKVRYKKGDGTTIVGQYYPKAKNILFEAHECTIDDISHEEIEQPLIHFHGTRDLEDRLAMMKKVRDDANGLRTF